MQCIKCGKKLKDDVEKCPTCGKTQPLSKSSTIKAHRPFLAGISIILFVLALLPLPIIIIGSLSLFFAGQLSDASLIETIFQIIKFILLTSGIPLILSIVCKILSK